MIPAAGLQTPGPAPKLSPGCYSTASFAGGELFVQGRVARAGERGLFDGVVGGGFALVSTQGDPAQVLGSEQRAFFASLGGVNRASLPRRCAARSRRRLHALVRGARAVVAPQRSDFAVFDTAQEPAGAGALVNALRARIASG